MAWSDTYPKIVATLAAKNGQWSAGVPKLTSADAIGTLAAYVGSLRVGVERATDGICPSSYVDADGIKRINVGVAPSISVAGYISKCTPVGGNAWKRYAADQPLVPSWEPFRDSTYIRNEQSEQLYGVREAMDAYQSAVNAITLGANLYRGVVWGEDPCKVALQKLRVLGSDLDSLAANPPTSLTDDLKGALDAASHASAKAAGKLTADVAGLAGDLAGDFASGFFGSATFTTIAAIAAYVAYKRFL